jgi:hypothetical protein
MDDYTDISGFLRKMQRGRPLNAEATTLLLNRIFNILEGLAGEGCSVDKPLDRKGLGWKFVVDGSHSDLEPAGRVPMPFELIAVDNAWHVWLLDAEVVVNNYHADKADNLQTSGGGRWTSASFAPGSSVYLYVADKSTTATKHGAHCYAWNVATSVPEGALASVLLGSVTDETHAVQRVRGNQVFYTFANSEILTHDNVNAVVHMVLDSASQTMPIDDHLAFVIRTGGVLRYYKATDLLKVAYRKAKDIIRNPPDPDVPTSDILPIGDETYEEWEARIKDAIRECLVNDGWPYMPEFSGESIWPGDDPEDFDYFGGWGVYDPVNDRFSSYWRGIGNDQLEEWHLPGRPQYDEILRLLQEIQDRLDELTDDPDDNGPQKSLLAQMCEQTAIASGRIATLQTILSSIDSNIETYDDLAAEAATLTADVTARLSALDTREDAIDDDVTDLEGLV